ncbi:hypothetical protein N9O88_01585 [bacterium]|nr:hypothetical protein [bacterium]
MSEHHFKTIQIYPNVDLPIDIDLIKKKYFEENGILNGANIFAILFKLIEAENFAPSTDSDINLRNFQITSGQWILLYGFIKNGFLPNCINNNDFINQLNRCYECTLRLGGIPAFDEYYLNQINLFKETDINLQKYNPMTPKEDNLKKYIWRTYNSIQPNNQTLFSNESITILTTNSSFIYYSRELIK